MTGPDGDTQQGSLPDQRRATDRYGDRPTGPGSSAEQVHDRPGTPARPDPAAAQEARRERFGGLNLGAAFFGWLVAVAVSVLLTGIIGAVLVAIGVDTEVSVTDSSLDAGDLGLTAAIVLLVVLMVGYYSGGYVAGRMSRFSGTKQGLGVWVVGLVITVVAVGLGALFGRQYDVLDRVDLPRIPVSTSTLTTQEIIAAAVVLLATLVAALVGGSVGTHYHRRVDRAGWDL